MRDGGFSLVEIIVTVVLLGVLAGVATLLLTGTVTGANKAACQSDVATINNAATIYYANKAHSAGSLNELVASGLLKQTATISGDSWIQPAYRVQFTPASPAVSGPGHAVGVSSTGCAVLTPTPALTGTLRIGAATSLAAAFAAAEGGLEANNPGLDVIVETAASSTILTRIQANPGVYDVFASADLANMNSAGSLMVAGSVRTFASNQLVIAVQPGNPKGITGLADLLDGNGVTVSLAGCGVPVGRYSRQILVNNDIDYVQPCANPAGADIPTPAHPAAPIGIISPTTFGADVGQVLTNVSGKTVDAGLVYATDAFGANTDGDPKNDVVAIPVAHPTNLVEYPIGVTAAASNPTAAQAFVNSVVSGDVQTILRSYGFLPPP